MTTFGEVSWEQDQNTGGGKKFESTKDLWLRLEKGDNIVRLVTAPFQYLSHKYKSPTEKGFGKKVFCSQANGSCPLCEMVKEGHEGAEKAKKRWLIGVISRTSGTYKILDISWSVFSDIQKLAKMTQYWGDPTKYDINIVVDPNGGSTGYYTVQALPKTPLSVEDQMIVDQVDLDDLKRRVTPPEPAKVQERIDKLNDGNTPAAGKTPAKGAPAASKPPATTKPSVDMSADDDEDFPDFDAK